LERFDGRQKIFVLRCQLGDLLLASVELFLVGGGVRVGA
jgi:hypothetical protein